MRERWLAGAAICVTTTMMALGCSDATASTDPTGAPTTTTTTPPSTTNASPIPASESNGATTNGSDPSSPSPSSSTPSSTPSPTSSSKLYGVTIDDVANLNDIVSSLKLLSHKPTARVVFDEGVAATYYVKPVDAIANVAFVMGELLDSFYVNTYSTTQYLARTDEYLGALGGKVDIWEVGNEINGEWLGDTPTVTAKMVGAYDKVKAAGKATALTLFYNEECWEKPDHEMFTWAQANIPAKMKQGLDYVLVSYYEDDCNGLQPDWNKVFNQLAQMFPTSKIGFGECGTTSSAQKATYVDRYYKMAITAPRFIGGYFWWYFAQDMVPSTKPLWTTLNAAIQ